MGEEWSLVCVSNSVSTTSADSESGLRYRGVHHSEKTDLTRQLSLTATTYRDESIDYAAIEYVSDGNGNETIPVFVTKLGNKVYIPPSIADLLRDKPSDQLGGSECGDESDPVTKKDKKGDSDSDSNNNDDSDDIGSGGKRGKLRVKVRRRRRAADSFDGETTDDDFDGVQVISKTRKLSKVSVAGMNVMEEEEDEDDDKFFFECEFFYAFWEQFKNVGPKLVPFLKTLGLYFVIFVPEDRPSLFAMTLKCLPIISLALFIVLHGIGLSDEHKFSRRILTGLVFSCLGDAFLIWPEYFLHGMAAFGVAQCYYIRAFGFEPLNWKLGLAVYTVTSSNLVLIMPALLADQGPLMVGVLGYSVMLTTMLWRAIARVEFSNGESLSWCKLSSCLGAISFAVSDTVLALNQFYTPIPYHQTIVMATYYAAQLGIALSVVTTKQEYRAVSSPSTDRNSTPVHTNLKDNDSLRLRKGKAVI